MVASDTHCCIGRAWRPALAGLTVAFALVANDTNAAGDPPAALPLVIGQAFTMPSDTLHETLGINVYLPPGFTSDSQQPLPVLYVPDGGLAEDFPHIAGLIQVGVGNGKVRRWPLIDIEKTERRRDLTGPVQGLYCDRPKPVVDRRRADEST